MTAQDHLTNRVKEFLEEQSLPGKGEELEKVRLLLRQRCKDDLWFLCYHALEMRDINTPLHRDMCERWMARWRHPYTLWLAPRLHLKTSIWTEGEALWVAISHPNVRRCIISANLELAVAMLANIRMYTLTKEVFRWLFPEYCIDLAPKDVARRCKDLTERLDFPCAERRIGAKEGSIEVLSVGSSKVSKHYDILHFDDAENDENVTTLDRRNKLWAWFQNAYSLRHSPKTSLMRLLGTIWHADGIYMRIINKERKRREYLKSEGEKVVPTWLIYRRSIIEPAPEGEGDNIAGKTNVRPIWPERFGKREIDDLLEQNGSYIFGCQYLLEPVSPENAIFKRDQIRFIPFYEIPDHVVNFMAIDLATGKKDGDFSVVTVASFDDLGRMYVREVYRERMNPSDLLEKIYSMIDKWKPLRVGIETVTFQEVIANEYKKHAISQGRNVPWVEMKRGKTEKSRRFLALQPRVERGDFLVEEGIQNVDWLVEEMTTFSLTHDPVHDDILDTLADLEVLFFSAPTVQVDNRPLDSYVAMYGSLDSDEESPYLLPSLPGGEQEINIAV